jgi:hypothetical protein
MYASPDHGRFYMWQYENAEAALLAETTVPEPAHEYATPANESEPIVAESVNEPVAEPMPEPKGATWARNEEHDGIEIRFPGKPERSVIDSLKSAGFRWSSRSMVWYAKDTPYHRQVAESLATGIGSVGEKLSYAEQIQAKRDRAEARQEHLETKAERLTDKADAEIGKSHAILDVIPFGQPILTGHHSEGRHRRDLERADNAMRRGFETQKEADRTAERLRGSISNIVRMDRPDVIKRRIDKIAADQRKVERNLASCRAKLEIGREYDYQKGDYITMTEEAKQKFDTSMEWSRNKIVEYGEQIAYWQGVLNQQGVTFLGPDDFKVGEQVKTRHGLAVVKRVNPKSLTVDLLDPVYGALGKDCKYEYERVARV